MLRKSDRLFEDVNELLGDPVLLEYEDVENYRALEKEIRRNLKPKNFLDALDVRDIVNSIWEGKRYRDSAAGLINAERGRALKKLIDPKFGYISDTERSRKAVENFKSGSDDEITRAALLKKLGIDSAALEAHAVRMAAKDYLILDEMVAGRNATRRAELTDHERRRALKAKRAATALKLKRKARKDSDWD